MDARPNLNGNTPQDFAAAYMALSDAVSAIDEAQRKVAGNVLHGRNYLTTDAGEDACIADRRRILDAMQQCRAILGSIASEIVDALDDHNR